jgi:hypothetical protein
METEELYGIIVDYVKHFVEYEQFIQGYYKWFR